MVRPYINTNQLEMDINKKIPFEQRTVNTQQEDQDQDEATQQSNWVATKSFKPQANSAMNGGVGVIYGPLSLGVGAALSSADKDEAIYGTTEASDFTLHYFGFYIGADLYIQHYKGFYEELSSTQSAQGSSSCSTTTDTSSSSSSPSTSSQTTSTLKTICLYPDLEIKKTGGTFFFVMFPQWFSLNAVFDQTAKLGARGFSPIFMLAAENLTLLNLPSEKVEEFELDEKFKDEYHLTSVSAMGGFGLTLKLSDINKKFKSSKLDKYTYFSLVLLGGNSYQVEGKLANLKKEDLENAAIGTKTQGRFAINVDQDVVFYGLWAIFDTLQFAAEDLEPNINVTSTSIELFGGLRF